MAQIPKRSDQRRRVNKPEIEIESAPSITSKRGPDLDLEDVHPLAADWYESLRTSGQAEFYTSSDWQTARIWTELLSRTLKKNAPSAMMVQAWASGATELLTTEGARRRMRIELERAKPVDVDEQAAVAKISEYRKRLSG